ncbi:hypothetical protein ACVIGB_008349 [Bradyrhizobium sp. USDA 4341]
MVAPAYGAWLRSAPDEARPLTFLLTAPDCDEVINHPFARPAIREPAPDQHVNGCTPGGRNSPHARLLSSVIQDPASSRAGWIGQWDGGLRGCPRLFLVGRRTADFALCANTVPCGSTSSATWMPSADAILCSDSRVGLAFPASISLTSAWRKPVSSAGSYCVHDLCSRRSRTFRAGNRWVCVGVRRLIRHDDAFRKLRQNTL